MRRPPAVLTVAGSDPSGGAGLQADLKTIGALGGYGMAVVTALTAQNTRGVDDVDAVSADFVAAQCDSLVTDVRIDAVKTGMLASAAVTDVVCEFVRSGLAGGVPVVVDPVMVSTSGHRLMAPDALDAMRRLVGCASIVTPNLAEAADERAMVTQGRRLLDLGVGAVLMKGGHLAGDPVDVLISADAVERFPQQRVATRNTHGTGCALSAALATLRPQLGSWSQAVAAAKTWLTEALRQADRLEIGAGAGPVHHLHRWW
jgi:hydroxymethylpyrimidine/phosphomethylpyrimidine kinase